MTATRHPTMTSLYLSSHYTTGKRTDCQDDTQHLCVPLPGAILHQPETEGLLLLFQQNHLQWNLTCTASTWHRMNKISSLPTCKRSTVGNKSLPFLIAGPRRTCKGGHAHQRALFLRSLWYSDTQIPISTDPSPFLILNNKDQLRSSQSESWLLIRLELS